MDRAIADTELTSVCVGTPSQTNGNLDLTYIRRVRELIGAAPEGKSARHTIVIRNAILPGTIHQIVVPVLEEYSGKKAGVDFGLCNNPEFLREVRLVTNTFCQDKKLNIFPAYLSPGFAFGGSCLPKDLRRIDGVLRNVRPHRIGPADSPILKIVIRLGRTVLHVPKFYVTESSTRPGKSYPDSRTHLSAYGA